MLRRLIAGVGTPLALMLALLLGDFAQFGVPFSVLVRPVVVTAGITALLFLLAAVLTRSIPKASLAACVMVLAIWSITVAVAVAGATMTVRGAYRFLRPDRPWRWERLHQTATMVSLVILAVAAFGAVRTSASIGSLQWPPVALANSGGPTINFILLDGYPRADVLGSLGFDNEPFLGELEARGFDVARSSSSNYDRTQHTLTAMLSMRHMLDIEALADPPADGPAYARFLSRLIAEGGEAVRTLRDHGYRVMTVTSPVVDVSIWGADVVDVGHLSDYEIHLFNDTYVGRWVVTGLGSEWMADAHREGVHEELDAMVASQGDGRFIWTHVMSPHPPYILGPGGRVAECFPGCRYWDPGIDSEGRLFGQIQELNVLVLDAIDRLPPDAVVVLFSDHGLPPVYGTSPFANLTAVRTPSQRDVVPHDATVITLLPRILNRYLGTQIPLPDDRHFLGSQPGTRLNLREVPAPPDP